MSNTAFPASELTFVIKETLNDGLALALRDGVSGKLFSHLLDPRGPGREQLHAAVFRWAASDLPQQLSEKPLFNLFALLFVDGLKVLHRFFPDAAPVSQTLADAQSFKDYIYQPACSKASHSSVLENYSRRLQADYSEMRDWFSKHTLIGETIRCIGNLCRKLMTQGKASGGNKRPAAVFGKGPQTAFMREQRRTFAKFLERRPITPSVSAITRAHQCWNEHRDEWNEAAKNGDGYFDHKKLARSI